MTRILEERERRPMMHSLTPMALFILLGLSGTTMAQTCQLENRFLSRKVAVSGGRLTTWNSGTNCATNY